MQPSDIELLATLGAPALLDDGYALVAVTRPDLAGDSYRGALYRVSPGGETRRWTNGPRDSAPSVSPDGRWVAFTRAGDGSGAAARPQLHLMPADGGEPVRLTELPLGVDAPVWAPDSRRIAFTARVPEPGRYGTGDDPVPAEREAPRRITRLDYRIDDVGYLADRPKRLFVLDALAAFAAREPARPEPVSGPETDVTDPAWLPDGTGVVVSAARDWGARETLQSDLYLIPDEGGTARLLVRSAGSAHHPAIAEDGTVWFLGVAFSGVDYAGRNTGLWRATLPEGDEPATPVRVTEPESVDCSGAAGRPLVLGDRVLVAVLDRGSVRLCAAPADGERLPLAKLSVLTGPRSSVRGFAAGEDGTIWAVLAGVSDSGELVRLGDQETVLTDFGKPLRDKGVFPRHELNALAPDGYPVHGWVTVPDGEGPHPVLLLIHGGPFAPYEWALFDETQVYVEAGYAVVQGNPRGSASYGQAHGRAVVRAFGTVDVDDLLALLDVALEHPALDASRVGVMGGSYGGFMTGWLAAHHGHRFRAAWSERAVNAWDSFAGTSDIGWEFAESYVGTDPKTLRDRSPLSHADKIDIPFAVVHSEWDWRCPFEQAQRMFTALRLAGKPAELLVFPGEGHELSRSGTPRHRKQRFEAVLDWWHRHLPVPR